MTPISIQLYTLRNEVKGDFPAVLRLLSDIGYAGVEFAGLHGLTPQEVATLLSDLNMRASSTHCPLPTSENIAQLADEANILGYKALISGFGPSQFTTLDDCKRTAEKFQTAAILAKEHGLTFGMHNHEFEFKALEDGTLPYEIVLEAAPEIFSELDVYWAAFGGQNPASLVAKHKGRLPFLHIKDGNLTPDRTMTAVGHGALDIPAVVKAADPNVLQWLVVELDACATDMVEAVRQSYAYLTKEGLRQGTK